MVSAPAGRRVMHGEPIDEFLPRYGKERLTPPWFVQETVLHQVVDQPGT
ncbi:hypothetical protein [Saccharomonospora viridis]|jgi:hypothetical protein|nr:hypothetical protein [Saccharomonospora viridis]